MPGPTFCRPLWFPSLTRRMPIRLVRLFHGLIVLGNQLSAWAIDSHDNHLRSFS